MGITFWTTLYVRVAELLWYTDHSILHALILVCIYWWL